jgi:hypothetical protein
MVLASWGVSVLQDDIIRRVKGVAIDAPGSDDEISACLNAWAVNVNGRWVRVRNRIGGGPLASWVLVGELTRHCPVMYVYCTEAEVSHAVVVTGVEYIVTPDGPRLMKLVYRDPDPSLMNVAKNGRVELVGEEEIAEFLSTVRRHWCVTIS